MSSATPLGIGFLGAGGVARRIHAPGFRLCPGVEIVSAYDPVAEAAASLNPRRVAADPTDLLGDPAVAAVVIAAPNHEHRPLALAALEAGKHVLCEKPLALNAAEAAEMAAAAERAGVVHMTAFTYGLIPAVRYLEALLAEGRIGTIRSVRAAYLMALSTHLLGWRSKKEFAGSGVLGDIGSHLIHIVERLAGGIARLSARQRRFRDDPSSDVEDWIAFLADFDNGACGSVEISRICPGRGADLTEEMTIEIYGSEGGVALSMQHPRGLLVALGENGRRPEAVLEPVDVPREYWKLPGGPRDVDEGDPRWSYRFDQAWRFVENIRDGVSRPPTFADGLRCQAVLDAALASADSGRWTDVVCPPIAAAAVLP